jgi:hypothetical protein
MKSNCFFFKQFSFDHGFDMNYWVSWSPCPVLQNIHKVTKSFRKPPSSGARHHKTGTSYASCAPGTVLLTLKPRSFLEGIRVRGRHGGLALQWSSLHATQNRAFGSTQQGFVWNDHIYILVSSIAPNHSSLYKAAIETRRPLFHGISKKL